MAQIRQRLLGGSHLLLNLAQLVGELNHEMSIPLALVWRQRHDTRQIVPQLTALLLTEVPDEVITLVVVLRHHVEIKGRYIEIQCFVIQEQLRDVRDVLCVHALREITVAVHLEHRYVVLAVDLVAWRTLYVTQLRHAHEEGALLHVAMEFLVCQEEAETVLADEELR